MQERKTYAKGSTLESTTGYVVKVGMPVVDDTVKATSNGATFTENAPLTDGQYLVTIEVNGEAVAYKESVTADSGITVGDYSVAENAGKIVLTGASANDIVRLLIEPLEVSVSDGFRAAINKAVPKSGGGGSGGGGANNIVYVDYTYQETGSAKTWTLTKTAGEILSLMNSGNIVFIQVDTDKYYQLAGVQKLGANSTSFRFPCIDPNPISQSDLTYPKVTYNPHPYQANGLSAYPTYAPQSGGGND
jgi:hypothetical protein